MSSHRLARLVALGGLALSVLAPVAPASAYSDSGTILKIAPGGLGVTDTEFQVSCPAPPKTQGVDGWVFTLPAPASAGETFSVTGSSPGPFSLAAYIYKDNCDYDRAETGGLSSVTLEAGDRFVSVYVYLGAGAVDVTFSSPAASATFPNDPLYRQSGEGDLFTAGQWNMRKVNAVPAWGQATGGGIKVAVLDSGLDLNHPDFNCTGKVSVVTGSDMVDNDSTPEDENGHGTHTAGIVGACSNNGVGVIGIAPDTTIIPIRVLNAAGSGTADQLVRGINKAVASGAHVINMSIGFSLAGAPATGGALGFFGFWPEIDEAIDNAVAAGVVVVASAGNDTSPICGYPAIAYNVICVGSTDPNDVQSWYSAFPNKDDDEDLTGPGMVAPGGRGVFFCDFSSSEIISTYDRGADTAEGDCDGLHGYASIQGTSMASPLVAGAAALVYDDLGGTRNLTNGKKVVEALTMSAEDLYSPGYDPASGYGRLDALAAVNYWP